MRYDAVLFDFDGTLADTSAGIYAALQAACAQMGRAPIAEELLPRFIGPPILDSADRYLGMDAETAMAFHRNFRAFYRAGELFNAKIYQGVPALLRWLHAEGVYVAVASAKPADMVQAILEHFGLTRFFDRVIGKTSENADTHKETMLREALPARYARAVMVGDRLYDMEAAKNLGLDAVGALWGFGTAEELTSSGADAVAADPAQCARILCGEDTKPPRGFFISIEGLDGCGKTTQMNALCEHIRACGYDVLCTREPGGTPIAEDIRALILDPEKTMCDETEALLYAASRCEHVHRKIRPALERGQVVLCDRFVDSSIAYQGGGRELGLDKVAQINAPAVDGTLPDLTLLFMVDARTAFLRRAAATKLDRLERAGEAFFQRVRDAYELLAETGAPRIRRIDASRPIAAVTEEACEAIDKLLAGR